MLKAFSWDMNGYIPKHSVDSSDNGITPILPRVRSMPPTFICSYGMLCSVSAWRRSVVCVLSDKLQDAPVNSMAVPQRQRCSQ